jgi:hypothetical protein
VEKGAAKATNLRRPRSVRHKLRLAEGILDVIEAAVSKARSSTSGQTPANAHETVAVVPPWKSAIASMVLSRLSRPSEATRPQPAPCRAAPPSAKLPARLCSTNARASTHARAKFRWRRARHTHTHAHPARWAAPVASARFWTTALRSEPRARARTCGPNSETVYKI